MKSASKLLYTKQEAMQLLQVGERTFRALGITYVRIGKRRFYAMKDLQAFIEKNRKVPECLNHVKEKARHTTGTISQSVVYDIEEVRRQIALKRQKRSLQSCA